MEGLCSRFKKIAQVNGKGKKATSKTPENANQQSLAVAGAVAGAGAGAAAEPPNNELQNPTGSERATGGFVAESGGNADSQSSDGASLSSDAGDGTSVEDAQDPILAVSPNGHHESSETGPQFQEEQHSTTDGATGLPIQEEGPTTSTGVGDSTTNGTTGQQMETASENYEDFLVSKTIEEEKTLQYKLAVRLNATSHSVIKNWEYLACTEIIKAPLEVRRKCKINSGNRCTMTLFEKVAVEQCDKTVKDLIDALTTIKRNEVKKLITDVYPDAANSTEKFSLFVANTVNRDLLAQIVSCLDGESKVNENWFGLGLQFGLSYVELDEIKFVPCMQVIMDYLYTNKPDLTIGKFYDVVKELKRGDVLEILDGIIETEEGDRTKLMKDVITPDSENMRNICVPLNKTNSTLKNWKYLASSPELGIPEDVIKGCTPEKPKGPMETLLEWIFAEKVDLTIKQLCQALASIRRNDVVEEIRKYFQPATRAQ